MRTEIYLENNRLDITGDISTLITFSIDEVQDFSTRSTSWSKTIVLPGTARNNQLFGNIFQVGQANAFNSALPNIGYNFNASKSADCIIFQDNIQSFKGVLRLMQVNIMKGQIEYEVSVFGDLAGLNVQLSSKLLEDLDFSEYDEVYNDTNIVASWDNPGGSGLYYPLIDYGTYSVLKHDWDIRTFRPALYVKEYIDKMFAMAGYRYDCDLFGTSRFKGLVIPHNKKKLTKIGTNLLTALKTTPEDLAFLSPDANYIYPFDTFSATGFSIDGTNQVITYDDAATVYLAFAFTVVGRYQCPPADDTYGEGTLFARLLVNGVEIYRYDFVPTDGPSGPLVDFEIDINLPAVLLNQNDTIELRFDYFAGTIPSTGDPSPAAAEIVVDNMSFIIGVQSGTAIVNVNPGDDLIVNNTLPTNVRQIDFLVSIVKLFNLYVYEDKFDNRLIKFTPYVDFYSTDSSDAIDWTYKLNRDALITLKPMSELNSKLYQFNYKSDSDYFNDLYNKRYGQVYGGYIFDSLFEFTAQKNSLELVFSSTPLVGYSDEDKVFSTIFKRTGTEIDPVEENVDSNIRILQTKKVTGVTSWDILDGVTVLASLTDYAYAGHLNDPDAPSDDINFGALKELFFTLVTGDLSNTQFNIYWSAYMAEITDKDSKLLTASFYLTPRDILELDFSKYVVVDGVLFRLNKITDYNMSRPSECKVELLKVINTSYFSSSGGGGGDEDTWTATRTETFSRNNCDEGYIGSAVPFSKIYTSDVSQTDADDQAASDPDYDTEGQAYANDPDNGATCSLIVGSRTIINETGKSNIYHDEVGGPDFSIPGFTSQALGFGVVTIVIHHDLSDVPIYVYDALGDGAQVDTVDGDGFTTQVVDDGGAIQIGGSLIIP